MMKKGYSIFTLFLALMLLAAPADFANGGGAADDGSLTVGFA
ncbi:MAG: hypothetical protein PF495_11520 [Spirochaetales bacterium]|jgi:hypothetical protein|nr:hypothetical protein [Spirochaetales bacterium]